MASGPITSWERDGETSLLFNMLSRFVIAFLPRSRCLLISWLQSLFVMILEGSQENPGGQVKIPFNEEKQLAVSYVAYC